MLGLSNVEVRVLRTSIYNIRLEAGRILLAEDDANVQVVNPDEADLDIRA